MTFKQDLSTEPTEKVQYDAESSKFIFSIKKANAGEQFTGLNMLTSLISPKTHENRKYTSKITVESSSDSQTLDFLEKKFSDLKLNNSVDSLKPRYGFMNKYDSIHLTHMVFIKF